jgi:hypothetical protein
MKRCTTELKNVITTGSISMVCRNLRKPVIPTIITSGAITVVFGTSSYSLLAGTHIMTDIVFAEGENILTITGTNGTTVEVQYREGAL